jgi:hypothetical protein
MSESRPPRLAPQGDRFEDQYTSATGDLSAGGVGAALDAALDQMVDEQQTAAAMRGSGEPWSAATVGSERVGQTRGGVYPRQYTTHRLESRLARPRIAYVGAGAMASVCAAIGGTLLYNRWQHERNKPINRLRRGAKDMAHRIGDRMPEVDDLPAGTAPIGTAASALILTGVVLSRAMRRSTESDRAAEISDQARDAFDALREALWQGRGAMQRGRDMPAVRDALDMGRGALEKGRDAAKHRGKEASAEVRKAKSSRGSGPFLGLGFGGLAIVAGGAYIVWRFMRGETRLSTPPTWYDTSKS